MSYATHKVWLTDNDGRRQKHHTNIRTAKSGHIKTDYGLLITKIIMSRNLHYFLDNYHLIVLLVKAADLSCTSLPTSYTARSEQGVDLMFSANPGPCRVQVQVVGENRPMH